MMYCILEFAQDEWKITGASNMSNMPVVDVHVMVLMCYVSIFLVLCYRNMWMVNSFQRISGIGRE